MSFVVFDCEPGSDWPESERLRYYDVEPVASVHEAHARVTERLQVGDRIKAAYYSRWSDVSMGLSLPYATTKPFGGEPGAWAMDMIYLQSPAVKRSTSEAKEIWAWARLHAFTWKQALFLIAFWAGVAYGIVRAIAAHPPWPVASAEVQGPVAKTVRVEITGEYMAIKPNGGTVAIKEQLIEDAASGLVLRFELLPDGTSKLTIAGDLPLGNREFIFSADGSLGGTGTAVGDICTPTWLYPVLDESK